MKQLIITYPPNALIIGHGELLNDIIYLEVAYNNSLYYFQLSINTFNSIIVDFEQFQVKYL
jgi:hypothetical protein